MNKEECIRIFNIATNSYVSNVEDNKYRYKLQYQKTPDLNPEYKEIIEHHEKLIKDLNEAFDYLKENLK